MARCFHLPDLGGGYTGIRDILSPFVYVTFHNENDFKKKNNTAHFELKRRVLG